jgi:Zn-dependent M28 family amino/carboxypeptidase
MKPRSKVIFILAANLCFYGCESPRDETIPISIDELLSQVSESEILATASDLQGFVTRVVGYQGNIDAATYIHERFTAMPGLNVTYQGGSQRNVIATLPGTDSAATKIYIVGAHYDSTSGTPAIAPGATDNACGVGIVLELARIMSKYSFKNDLKFVAWNAEEAGSAGSYAYVSEAELNHENIGLYVNYDSAGYDPDGRLILDIMYNDNSQGAAELMKRYNSLYGLGFTITYNVHIGCTSDHRPFWKHGISSVMTHSEVHGPAHTADDTVDKISTLYAKKNGQLGMAILAELAGLTTTR